MLTEASITSIWKKQKLFVGIFLVGIGGWFYYDGIFPWPKSNLHFDAHTAYLKDGGTDWPKYAAEKGFPAELPHKRYESMDIAGQFAFGSLAALAGLSVLIYLATQFRRTVKADPEAVYSPAGVRIPYSDITGVGKKKWADKGLATIRYEIDGKKGEFILDDYKFERQPITAILAEIESHFSQPAEPEEPSDSTEPTPKDS